jgi:hypothetical protein
MKHLCKLALLILAAKILVSPPKAGHDMVAKVGSLTMRDVASHINDAWMGAEHWVCNLWTSSEVPAKVSGHRGAAAHHPAN